ncbi:MAG: Ig-like domain-containing protein, partial [Candidatus Kerfeldbacteria bacterium]|nr:Ig-like domain-containing protein [Candidatus Kerfeldbacteria bacterium]
NEEKIERAKKIIINAVIGLVVVLLSWAIVFFVNGVLEDVTGSGDNPGEIPCQGSECNYPPGSVFKVREITTTCGDGKNYAHDVAQCSAIQIEFNYPVNVEEVKTAVQDGKIFIDACGSGSGGDGSDLSTCQVSSPIWSAQVYDDDGVWPASAPDSDKDKGIWLASGNTLVFYRPLDGSLWPGGKAEDNLEQYYRVHLPDTLPEQYDELRLSECTPSDGTCQHDESNDEHTWMYWVGEFIDTTAPFIESSYPIREGDGYPDINVNRAPILWSQFNEPVQTQAFLDVDETIEIYECTDNAQACATMDEVPDTLYHDSIAAKNGKGYELQFSEPLKGFQWYKIIVKGVKDLCENEMETTEWVFQTNNEIPGVVNVYPQNDWPYDVCPDVDVMVHFNTSMYNTEIQECGVPAGHVKGEEELANQRRLTVLDPDGGACGSDPNACCKQYAYRPLDEHLAVQTYNPSVFTDMLYERPDKLLKVPDAARDWAFKEWEFTVGDFGACVNPPLVTGVLPTSGGTRQCVTVSGRGFETGGEIGKEDQNQLFFRETEAEEYEDKWSNDRIIGRVPQGLSTGRSDVSVDVYYPAQDFHYTTSLPDAYTVTNDPGGGACLTDVNPDSQVRGAGVSFAGTDFDGNSTKREAVFSDNVVSAASNWTDTSAASTVPDDAKIGDGLVKIRNDEGDSNPLPFYVVPPGSPWIQFSNACALPGSPSPNPQPDATESCPNALSISASFTMDMDETTFTEENILLQECLSGNCDNLDSPISPEEIRVYNTGQPGEGFQYLLPENLKAGTTYQATLSTQMTGANHAPLPSPFVWKFTTRSAHCQVDSATLSPDALTTSIPDALFDYQAYGYNGASCTPLRSENAFYDWSVSNDAVGNFVDLSTSEDNNQFKSQFPADEQTQTVLPRVDIQPYGISDTSSFTFNVIPCNQGVGQCVPKPEACAGIPDGFCSKDSCVCKRGFKIVTRDPEPNETDVARNRAVTVTFNQPVDITTFTPTSVQMYYDPVEAGCPGGIPAQGGSLPCLADQLTFRDLTGGRVVFDPHTDPYLLEGEYEVVIGSTVASASGVELGTPDQYGFSVSGVFAAIDRVETLVSNGILYTPDTSDGFSCNHNNCDDDRDGNLAGNQHNYQSRLYDGDGHLLVGDHKWSDDDDPNMVVLTGGSCIGIESCYAVGTSDSGTETSGVEVIPVSGTSGGQEKSTDFIVTADITSGGEGDWCSKKENQCDPNPSACNLGLTCNQTCRCEAIDFAVLTRDPAANEEHICRNRVVTVEFNQPIDFASFDGKVTVNWQPHGRQDCDLLAHQDTDSWFGSIASRITGLFRGKDANAAMCSSEAKLSQVNATTIEIDPHADNPSLQYAKYYVTIDQSVESLYGTPLGETENYWFSTDNTYCAADHVVTEISEDDMYWVQTTRDLFTCQQDQCAGDVDGGRAGNQHFYRSTIYEKNDHMITGTQGWVDPTNPGGAANIALRATCTDQSRCDVLATADSSTSPDAEDRMSITGTAGDKNAQAIFSVESSSCSQPWPSPFPYRYQDWEHASNQYFDMWYCRDGDLPTLLPEDPYTNEVSDQNFTVTPGDGSDDIMREIFFPVEDTLEPIVVRVMENENHLDPAKWFAKKFPGETAPIQSLTVDGFEAVRVNNTVYIAGANYTGAGLYTNIYVFTLDLFAGAQAVNIFNQLLENVHFLSHSDMNGVCVEAPDSNKECITRDTWRYADQQEIIDLMTAYHDENDQYPAVGSGENEPGGAGSFVKGITNNRWSRSWTSLANALGTALPNDPVNEFAPISSCPAPPYEQSTCWDATSKFYRCPSESLIYQFMTPDEGETGELYSRFEYEGLHSWATNRGARLNPCSEDPFNTSASCGCFNNSYLGDTGGNWLHGVRPD